MAKTRSSDDNRQLLEETRRELQQVKEEQKKMKAYEQAFMLNMSHELLGSLNSIQILSNLLMENRDKNLSSKQLNYARIINDSGKEMLSVLTDVQDLARIMAGNMAINTDEMALTHLTTYLKQHYETTCTNKGLQFTIVMGKEVPEKFVTDRYGVEKILKNLISNAIKFTDHGGITVRFKQVTPPLTSTGKSCHLSIAVEDTGIGIPGDKKEVIFEAFRAYKDDVQQSLTGAGLGLSISRALAGLLHGEIQLISVPGKGSIFTLILPELELPVQTAESPEAGESTFQINSIRDDRHDIGENELSLLVVEDDPNFAQILFDATREIGFKCLIAEDGEAGLHMANQFLPDAIILDFGLPRIDGLQVLRKLKEKSHTQAIPVFMISGFDKKQEAIRQGAIGYLNKPLSMDRLFQTLQHLKKAIQQGQQKIVVYNPGLEDNDFPLNMLQRASFVYTTAGSLYDIKELFLNGIGRCLLVDMSDSDQLVFDIFNSFMDHPILQEIPILLGHVHKLDSGDRKRLEGYEDQLSIIQTASEGELLNNLEHMFPESREIAHMNTTERLSFFSPLSLFNGKTILLADADRRNLYALSSILKEKEIDVITVDCGDKVLETLKNNPQVNLLMLNMEFPQFDGLDLIQKIRTLYNFEQLPIIAFNDRAMKGDRQKCIQAGANEYLAKPIIMAKLNAMLQVWLNP